MIKIKTHGFFYDLNFGWVEEHITFCVNKLSSAVVGER
jgi:hypothetical protein